MKWIRLLKAVGDKPAGEFLSVDEATSRAYIDAGLAEDGGNGPEHHLMREAVSEFQKQMAGLVRETAESIQAATKAIPRPGVSAGTIEAGPSEADKRRSYTDYFRQAVTALTSPDMEARGQAHQQLTKPWEEGGYGVNRNAVEGQGSAGGYTTPVIYENQVFKVMEEDQVLANAATPMPLSNRQHSWPSLDQYSAPATGQSAFFGGVSVFRRTEVAQRQSSFARWAKIDLVANDLTAYTTISRDLMADSTISYDSYLIDLIGRAMGWREDWECLNGIGANGQFLGLLNAPATINVTRNTGGSIRYADIARMYTRLLPASKKQSRWILHPYTMETLLNLVDGSNRLIFQPYLTPSGESTVGVAPRYQLLGLPVYESEKVPTLGNAGDLMLVDPKGYWIGRRSGLEIGVSEHFLFDTDRIAIRAKLRNDGQPALRTAIPLADGSNTASFFVSLN